MNMNERQIYQKHASFKYPPSSSVVPLLHPVIFYSLTRGEFNKYMQMCAVEHDECKSGEDVLWTLLRLRLRADPGLIIFHFPIAFNSAAAVHVHTPRVCVRLCNTMCHTCVSLSSRHNPLQLWYIQFQLFGRCRSINKYEIMCFYFTCFFFNLHFSTSLSSVTALVLFLFFHIPEMFIFARDKRTEIL